MKPVVFCHVPKCGGQSVGAQLREWFDHRARPQYRGDTPHVIDLERQLPEEYRPVVIFGHFIGCRTDEWYPKEYLGDHAVMLREPLRRFVSAFNFVNRKKTCCETPEEFLDGGNRLMLDAMHSVPLPLEDCALVGTTERIDDFTAGLARMLGKEPPAKTPHRNVSEGLVVDDLSPELVAEHRRRYAEEHDLYGRASAWR